MARNYTGNYTHMSASLPENAGRLLVELVEKVGLLRRDLQHRGDLETYAARVARIEQKLLALADAIEGADAGVAKAVRDAWTLPARSLAFRNAEHKKD